MFSGHGREGENLALVWEKASSQRGTLKLLMDKRVQRKLPLKAEETIKPMVR